MDSDEFVYDAELDAIGMQAFADASKYIDAYRARRRKEGKRVPQIGTLIPLHGSYYLGYVSGYMAGVAAKEGG